MTNKRPIWAFFRSCGFLYTLTSFIHNSEDVKDGFLLIPVRLSPVFLQECVQAKKYAYQLFNILLYGFIQKWQIVFYHIHSLIFAEFSFTLSQKQLPHLKHGRRTNEDTNELSVNVALCHLLTQPNT